MSLVEDESLNGSVVIGKLPEDYSEHKPKLNLRDRIIDFVKTHEKPTKSDIFINVSSSGTTQQIVSGLIKREIFIEKFLECHNCTYFELDESKIIEL